MLSSAGSVIAVSFPEQSLRPEDLGRLAPARAVTADCSSSSSFTAAARAVEPRALFSRRAPRLVAIDHRPAGLRTTRGADGDARGRGHAIKPRPRAEFLRRRRCGRLGRRGGLGGRGAGFLGVPEVVRRQRHGGIERVAGLWAAGPDQDLVALPDGQRGQPGEAASVRGPRSPVVRHLDPDVEAAQRPYEAGRGPRVQAQPVLHGQSQLFGRAAVLAAEPRSSGAAASSSLPSCSVFIRSAAGLARHLLQRAPAPASAAAATAPSTSGASESRIGPAS